MESRELPPLPVSRISRLRWWMHLLLLAGYTSVVGALSFISRSPGQEAALSPNIPALLIGVGVELVIFSALFSAAWFFSRASMDQLFLRWREGVKPVLWGLLYSVLLRIGVGIAAAMVLYAIAYLGGQNMEELAKAVRPETERLVDFDQLLNSPAYLWLNLTLVSFVLAGLREELWRAGMLAAFRALFPSWFTSLGRSAFPVALVAIFFGLGHLAQGWGGVVATGFLGFGLGMIIVGHRSIWPAVLAHGFFNAGSFAAMAFLARHPELMEKYLGQ